jgi:Ser/Thr protein kinase RdoA (MazF antagonist)
VAKNDPSAETPVVADPPEAIRIPPPRHAVIAIGQELSGQALPVPQPLVEEALARWYGLDSAVVTPIASERDQMFRVTAAGSDHFLKISHVAEDPAVAQMQVAALRHIATTDPSLPVPRIVRALDGRDLLRHPMAGHDRTVWMQHALPGVPFAHVPSTPVTRRALGRMAGRTARALRGFFHPAAGRVIGWDIKGAAGLRPLLETIAEPERRAIPLAALDGFEREAAPRLPALRAQIVHNDFNPHNLLVDPEDHGVISAVFDFGDMVHTALAADVAIAAAYQMFTEDDPFGAAVDVVAGYHTSVPLEGDELDLLYDLIAARLAMTIAITEWRAARNPENRAYVMKNAGTAWNGLAALSRISRDDARRRLRSALNP